MFRLGLLALAALAACTDAVDVAQNTCGNYVYEPSNNEDCDSPGVGCNTACRVVCDPTAAATTCATLGDGAPAVDGTCCPSGATCGQDAICHVPSGFLSSQATSAPFQASQYVVSDLDGDGFGDVLGFNSASVQARYGAASSPFATQVSQLAPFATGTAAIGDYNGDGHLDVIVPITAGLYAFDTSSGAPQPVAFPASPQTATALHDRIGAVVDPLTTASYSMRIDITPGTTTPVTFVSVKQEFTATPAAPVTANDPCSQFTVAGHALAGRSLHARWRTGIGAGPQLPVTVAQGSTAANPIVACVWEPSNPTQTQTIAIPSTVGGNTITGTTIGETLLAQVEGGACPDLIVPAVVKVGSAEAQAGFVVAPGVGNPPTVPCTINTSAAAMTSAAIGPPLATVALQGGGTGLVTSTGIWALESTTAGLNCRGVMVGSTASSLCQIAPATRAWLYATTGDFNGDGLADVATSSTAQDVEVVQQVNVAIGLPQWAERRIPTAGVVYLVDAGDFDGDGFSDLAITSLDNVNDRTGDVQFAYGSPDAQFSAPVDVVSIPEFNDLAVSQISDPGLLAGFDHFSDLIIGHDDSGDTIGEATVVYGSGSRTPSAPFYVIDPLGRVGSGGVAIGAYGAGGMPGAFAIFSVPLALSNGTQIPNAKAVQFTPDSGSFDTVLSSPPIETCQSTKEFCDRSATYLSVARPDGDLLMAFNGWASSASPPVNYIGDYYHADGSGPSSTDMAYTDVVPGGAPSATTFFRQIVRAHVIDGNGTDTARVELLAQSSAATNPYTLYLFDLGFSGTPTLTNGLDVSADIKSATGTTANCMDVVPIELGTRTINGNVFGLGTDLAVACTTTVGSKTTTKIFARFANPDPTMPAFVLQLVDVGINTFVDLEVGDVNGDGLPDLLYTAGAAGEETIYVHLQCDSHQTCTLGV